MSCKGDNITNSPSLEADERYEADGFPAHRRHHSPAPKPHRTKEVSEWSLSHIAVANTPAAGELFAVRGGRGRDMP